MPLRAVISPLLANISRPAQPPPAESGVERVRYTDDFVLLWRSEEEARAALGRVQRWVEANGLMLHPEKPASSMRRMCSGRLRSGGSHYAPTLSGLEGCQLEISSVGMPDVFTPVVR